MLAPARVLAQGGKPCPPFPLPFYTGKQVFAGFPTHSVAVEYHSWRESGITPRGGEAARANCTMLAVLHWHASQLYHMSELETARRIVFLTMLPYFGAGEGDCKGD